MTDNERKLDYLWQNWNGPSHVLDLGEASELITKLIEINGSNTVSEQQRYRDFHREALITLKRKYKVDRFEINAEVEVVKGRKKVLVINDFSVLKTIFGVDLGNSNIDFFADIYSDEEGVDIKKIKTRIITSNSVKPEDRHSVVISQKLAKKIGVNNGGRIVISRIYQDMDQVDLDKLI